MPLWGIRRGEALGLAELARIHPRNFRASLSISVDIGYTGFLSFSCVPLNGGKIHPCFHYTMPCGQMRLRGEHVWLITAVYWDLKIKLAWSSPSVDHMIWYDTYIWSHIYLILINISFKFFSSSHLQRQLVWWGSDISHSSCSLQRYKAKARGFGGCQVVEPGPSHHWVSQVTQCRQVPWKQRRHLAGAVQLPWELGVRARTAQLSSAPWGRLLAHLPLQWKWEQPNLCKRGRRAALWLMHSEVPLLVQHCKNRRTVHTCQPSRTARCATLAEASQGNAAAGDLCSCTITRQWTPTSVQQSEHSKPKPSPLPFKTTWLFLQLMTPRNKPQNVKHGYLGNSSWQRCLVKSLPSWFFFN